MEFYGSDWIRHNNYLHGYEQLMQHLKSTSDSHKILAFDQVYKLIKFEEAKCKEDCQSSG